MNKRGNFRFLAFGIVFIVLMLFLYFRPDVNTGYVSYDFTSPETENSGKFYAGQLINGSFKFTIDANEKLYNNTQYKLGLFLGDDPKVFSQVLTADYIFNKTFNVEKIGDSSGFYFKTATIKRDFYFKLLNFSLKYDTPGNYIIKFYDGTASPKNKNIEILQAIDKIDSATFAIFRNNDIVFSDTFFKNETIGCGVEFSGTSELNISIYAPGDLQGQPIKFFNDTTHSTSQDVICDPSGCVVIYTPPVLKTGDWYCVAVLGNLMKNSDPMEMILNPPLLLKDIPDITIDVSGNLIHPNNLSLNDYFYDPQGFDLKYKSTGARYIKFGFFNNGTLNITNPSGFQGIESIIISADNGHARNLSNQIDIIVGDGQVVPSSGPLCQPFWDCEIWSECISGQQTRKCEDLNNCNVNTGKPLEAQRCTSDGLSEQINANAQPAIANIQVKNPLIGGGGRIILIIVAVLALLGSAGFAGYWFFIRKDKSIQKTKQTEETKEQVASTKAVNLNEMNKYVEVAINNGQSQKKLKDDLINAGWDKKDVSESINYYVLKKYVKDKIATKVDKAKLKQSLIAKGWKKEIVEKIFLELKI